MNDDDGKIWTLFWFDVQSGQWESEVCLTYHGVVDKYHRMRGYERELNIHSLRVFEGVNVTDNL